MKTRLFLPTIMAFFFLTGCYVTSWSQYDPIYEDRTHSLEVFYWSDTELGGNPYWGYWQGFYYYYGTPHYYPWWYYYSMIPPHHYHLHTHVHVHCDNGWYVYGHRGSKFNNSKGGKYIAQIKEQKPGDKSRVFPISWKSHNSSIRTKHNDGKFNLNNNNVRPVDNRIYVKPNKNHNRNNSIIKNNTTKPSRTNNKVNINKKRP
jgi:hypothetical protein